MVTQMCPPEIEESIDYPEELDNDEVVRLSELRAEEMVSVHKKMMERIAEAQRRQKKDYARRLGKGVKSFLFQVDDIVEKRNMRRTTRKGDTLEPLWMVCWSLTSLCHSNGHIETCLSGWDRTEL